MLQDWSGVYMSCSRAHKTERMRERKEGAYATPHSFTNTAVLPLYDIITWSTGFTTAEEISHNICAVWAIYSPNATQKPQCVRAMRRVKSASQKIASSNHWTIVNTRRECSSESLKRIGSFERFTSMILWFILKYTVILSVTDPAWVVTFVTITVYSSSSLVVKKNANVRMYFV